MSPCDFVALVGTRRRTRPLLDPFGRDTVAPLPYFAAVHHASSSPTKAPPSSKPRRSTFPRTGIMRADERSVLDWLTDGLGRADDFHFIQHMTATTEIRLHRLGHRLLDAQLIRTPLLVKTRTRQGLGRRVSFIQDMQ